VGRDRQRDKSEEGLQLWLKEGEKQEEKQEWEVLQLWLRDRQKERGETERETKVRRDFSSG
jgi:hypothetical protein